MPIPAIDEIFVTIRPPAPASTSDVDALEAKLQFTLPTGFRDFLTSIGPCTMVNLQIHGPEAICEKTEKHGTQIKAYGLTAIPESLADVSLKKAVILADNNVFCHPKVPNRIYRLEESAIVELGESFNCLLETVRKSKGESLRRLYATPTPCPNRVTQNLMSARRKHCFEAVHLMLAPSDPELGETLEYDEAANKFLLGLKAINGTVFCSCQLEDHRIRIDYDTNCDASAIANLLALMERLGYVDPTDGAPVGASPNAMVTEDAVFVNEQVIAVIHEYGLDKGPIAGDLVFTNCRLLFFHSYETEVSVQGMSIQDLLSEGLRYDVYEYSNIRKVVLKRNVFGRSTAVVVPKNAAKNKFWGPKKNMNEVIAAAQELRDLGLPLHIAL